MHLYVGHVCVKRGGGGVNQQHGKRLVGNAASWNKGHREVLKHDRPKVRQVCKVSRECVDDGEGHFNPLEGCDVANPERELCE